MGGKHPSPGPVYIVSQYNGYAVGKNDEHHIITSKTKEPRGITGWKISNIPNDENVGRLGYNIIIHNKHLSKLLGCDENGQITVSETRKWNSLSGWRIIQKKDTNIYQFICHNNYWLSMNDNAEIIMLKKDQLNHNNKENWYLEYISKEKMTEKVPSMEQNEMKQKESQMKETEEIIQSILNRKSKSQNEHQNSVIISKKSRQKKPVKSKKCLAQNDYDNGYEVDIESDDNALSESKLNYLEFKPKKKQLYNQQEMDKKFESLTEILTNSFKELCTSIQCIRSDIASLKNEMKIMEQRQQINTGKIKKKLDLLQRDMNNKYINGETVNDTNDKDSEDRRKLKDWLTNTVGFGGYYSAFIKNGFDSLKIVQHINDPQQLSDIGISLKGHQLQIMAEVLQLKQKNVNLYDQCNYI